MTHLGGHINRVNTTDHNNTLILLPHNSRQYLGSHVATWGPTGPGVYTKIAIRRFRGAKNFIIETLVLMTSWQQHKDNCKSPSKISPLTKTLENYHSQFDCHCRTWQSQHSMTEADQIPCSHLVATIFFPCEHADFAYHLNVCILSKSFYFLS